MAALRFDFGRSFAVVGNVLVPGFVLGKILAVVSKIAAILVLGRLASILRRPAVDLGAVWAVLGRLGRDFGAKMGSKINPNHDQNFEIISRSIFGAAPESLGPTCSDVGPSWVFSFRKTLFFENC